MPYLISRMCRECGRVYSYLNTTPEQDRDCPLCRVQTAREFSAKVNKRNGKTTVKPTLSPETRAKVRQRVLKGKP